MLLKFRLACCSTLLVSNLKQTIFSGNYTATPEDTYNNRPVFRKDEIYAVWFDNGKWIIGLVSDLEKGTFSAGYVMSNENTSLPKLFCQSPTTVGTWREWIDDKWLNNNDAVVQCVGECK